MAAETGIAWCDSTFNPWIGCTKVGPGCDNCYAETLMDHRMHRVQWGPGNPRSLTSESNRALPLKWERDHAKFEAEHGRRRRVFCSSLSDVFDNEVPAEWRTELFALIDSTPHLDWLLLTKRVGNVQAMIERVGMTRLPPNVWIGATVVNQPEYDREIGKLLRLRAAVHFLSMEPMLGPIDMRMGGASMPDHSAHRPLAPLSWCIVGGESGHHARPFDVSWARSIVAQCKDAGVPVLVKQLGAKPRGWCAALVHADDDTREDAEPDHCDLYEASESGPCRGKCVMLTDPAGGDMAEWPDDLRVREWPASPGASAA